MAASYVTSTAILHDLSYEKYVVPTIGSYVIIINSVSNWAPSCSIIILPFLCDAYMNTSRDLDNFGLKARLHTRFLMRFRVKKRALLYPARMLFLAKHRMDGKERYHVLFEDTLHSNFCLLGGILSQRYATKNPCGVAGAGFVRKIASKSHEKSHV